MGLAKNAYLYVNRNISEYLKTFDVKTRPNASHGFWVPFMLPLCLGICILKHSTSDIFKINFLYSLGLNLVTIFVILSPTIKTKYNKICEIILLGLITSLISTTYLKHDVFSALTRAILLNIFYKYGLLYLMKKCPASFTFGEAAVVVQSLILFALSTIMNLVQNYKELSNDETNIITIILQVGMSSVILIVITLATLNTDVDIKRFTSVVSFNVILMLTVLHILLKGSPILWILNFIISSQRRIFLIGYWVAVTILTVIAVSMQISSGSKATTSHRKIFHILAVAVYIPGIVYECNLVYLASGIAFAAIVALETVRKSNIGEFSTVLDSGFQLFADEKDVGGISITPMYLLLGMAGPIFINPNCTTLPLLSGILSVGIGDTAASYIGSKYGRNKWPGTCKSIEGTIANVAIQSAVLIVLYRYLNVAAMNGAILTSLSAIVATSLVEAFTDQVDNIVLPLIMFFVLNLA